MAEASSGETKAKLEVMAHFNKDASGFDFERTGAGYRLRHRLVKSLFLKQYRLGAIALDMGCGTVSTLYH
jgi:ubiquinone/menaquinone biosynthesis C-methylase UbiE